ncbi:MAG: hypothetical protein ACRDZY_00490 [Acidimicrobiales bacterium]
MAVEAPVVVEAGKSLSSRLSGADPAPAADETGHLHPGGYRLQGEGR